MRITTTNPRTQPEILEMLAGRGCLMPDVSLVLDALTETRQMVVMSHVIRVNESSESKVTDETRFRAGPKSLKHPAGPGQKLIHCRDMDWWK